ncbi:hypothetical protein [Reinekea blandensis]|uniref:Uncharacterized protein n=1 Tax=Reinekea blandensis MED297 TaxID=314283 RepID=A4BF64_9GAMM|nr:hypothetical protein [Reinekea blandensis]EAR09177.1 hypothetical protein MED297_06838 [Reinekea sp. MED297] [Reinekea blandensis MED297]
MKKVSLVLMTTLMAGGIALQAQAEDATGALVVPVIGEKDIHADYIEKYRVVTSEGEVFYLRANQDKLLVKGLQPGTHTINSVEAMDIDKGKLGATNPVNIEFTIEEGKVTVLPTTFEVTLKRNPDWADDDYHVMQEWAFVTTTDETADQLAATYSNAL